jgi:hypothetical protein
MQIDIGIKINGKGKGGLMGVSLEEIQKKSTITKKKKKKKTALQKVVDSTIPKKSKYEVEVV